MASGLLLVWFLWIQRHTIVCARPNVVFILVDDIGLNDVQFTSRDLGSPSTDTVTPHLNELATNGVILTNYYVHRMCSPTRAAFLTGRLAFRYSLNTHLLQPDVAVSLTRQVSMISEEFKAAGYATHLIGKWHLGFQSWEYTPNYRGFDSFYGYYNAFADYYVSNYDLCVGDGEYTFYDLHNNQEPVLLDGDPSDYSTYRFRDEAIRIIEQSDGDTPFFMYLALQSSHIPSEAPDYYSDMYAHSDKTMTRIYNQAQTTAMDDAVGVVIQALKASDLWDNTLLVFSSDNGAAPSYGDNFPLRGYKKTVFEGALRVPALVGGGYLPESVHGTTFGSDDAYVHVTDWYPTLLDAAGIAPTYVKSTRKVDEDYTPEWETVGYHVPLDGISFWNELITETDTMSPRLMVLDINRVASCDCLNGTVRWGKWKYMRGLGTYSGTNPDGDDGYLWGDAFADVSDAPHLWGQGYANLDVDNALGCDLNTTPTNLYCFYSEMGCLFDISADPCEFTDLSETWPLTLAYLQGALQDLQSKLPMDLEDDGLILTAQSVEDWIPYASGFWDPWQDYEAVEFESILYDEYKRLYGQHETQVAMDGVSMDLDSTYNYLRWSWPVVVMSVVAITALFMCKIHWQTRQKMEQKKTSYGSTDM
eukprot:300205_1